MADLQSASISLSKMKVRWEEPYVSEAVNTAHSTIPRGVYRGFIARASATPNKYFALEIDPILAGKDPDSTLVYWDRADGFAVVVRENTEPSFNMAGRFTANGNTEIPAGGEIWNVWADVSYSVSSATSGTYHVTLSGDPVPDDAIMLAQITMPAGATTIINSYISTDVMTLPFPTKREDGAYVADDQYFGFLTGEEAWNVPSSDHKRAMNAASPVATATNPFLTKDSLPVLDRDLIPVTPDIYDLGDAVNRWQSLYLSTSLTTGIANVLNYLDVVASGDAGKGCAHLYPIIDDFCDFGSDASSKRWRTIYVNSIDLSDAAGKGFRTNLVPYSNGTLDLGNSSYRWKDLYIANIVIGGEITGGLTPSTDDTYDLGAEGQGWDLLYARRTRGDQLQCSSISGGTAPKEMTKVEISQNAWRVPAVDSHGKACAWSTGNKREITAGSNHELLVDMAYMCVEGRDRIFAVGIDDGMYGTIYYGDSLETGLTASISGSLITAGDWRFDSICADGNGALFVQATKMDVTDQYEHRVFAFQCGGANKTITGLKSGWGSAGIQIGAAAADADFDSGVLDRCHPFRIIMATPTRVACVNSWITTTYDESDPLLSVFDAADGGNLLERSGQTTITTLGEHYIGALESDGTNLYFASMDDTSDFTIHRIDIATLNTAYVKIAQPASDEYTNDLIWTGDMLYWSVYNTVYGAHLGGTANQGKIFETTFKDGIIHMGYDGKRIWVNGIEDLDPGTGYAYHVLARSFPVGSSYIVPSGTNPSCTHMEVISAPTEAQGLSPSLVQVGKFLFDGFNMLMIPVEDDDGGSMGSQIRVISQVGFRP